jgi:hypothetical protein
MVTLKNLSAAVVAAHGIGFSLWFLASWLGMKTGSGSQWLFSDLTITSPAGKLFGIVALILIVGFLATAVGIFTSASWWPAVGLVSATAAMLVVVPWWNVVPLTSALGASVVNAALILAAFISGAGQQLLQRA